MSSILKALKKLEEEKARQKGAQVDLVQNILRGEQRPGETSAWRLPALVLGLLLAGGAVGVLAVSWLGHSSLPLDAEPVASPGGTQSLTPTEAVSAVALPPSPLPQTVVPGPEPQAAERPVAEDTATQVPVPEKSRLSQVTGTPVADAAPPPGSDPPPAAELKPAPPTVEALVVSGIVYQDDPDGRIAVVNDLPVMQGTPVAGAVVEEILSDRVRFSRDGESFEVQLQQ